MTAMLNNPAFPARLLLLVSFVQGLALYLLHLSIESELWPDDALPWLSSLYTMAIVGPVMLLLGLRSGREAAVAKWTLLFTATCGLLGYYVGRQVMLAEQAVGVFPITVTVATFKALMYVQQFVSGERFSYGQLFRRSWRNFLTFWLSLLFAAAVWGILTLWAALFRAIDVEYFHELFNKTWFFYPVVALANGCGVIVLRSLSQVIDMITRLQQALMKFLLVLLALVSTLFLFALLATGLTELWENGGSLLILWMQALMLFFVNAVYQDDPDARPYHPWVHRFIYCSVALLPVYSAISLYGLSVRIDQHGLSPERCWALLVWLILALFSVAYLWGILRQRDNWLHQLSRTNVVMGLAVLVCMLLLNTPLLDFRKMTVNSQLQRLDSGRVSLDDLDIKYFNRRLARPGYLALQDVKSKYAESNPELAIRIDSLYADDAEGDAGPSKEDFLAVVQVVSGDMPDALGDAIYNSLSKWHLQNIRHCYLAPLDLNGDGQAEYLFVQERREHNEYTLYYLEGDEWQTRATSLRWLGDESGDGENREERALSALKAGELELVEPEWKDLRIGDLLLKVD